MTSRSDEPLPCCPICDFEWDQSINKEAHVAACLGDEEPLTSTSTNPRQSSKRNEEPSSESDEIEFLYSNKPLQTKPQDPKHHLLRSDTIPHLLHHIYKLLSQSFHDGHIRSATVCTPDVLYIRTRPSLSIRGAGDMAWGCGYRNMQMVLSAVRHLDVYQAALISNPELNPQVTSKASSSSSSSSKRPSQILRDGESIEIPSTQVWQRIIEAAWKEGFDAPGAESFSHKLVDKKKWIGTTEAYVAFTSLGIRFVEAFIRARVIDFPKPTGPKGTHLGLTNWVRDYFNEPPLSDPQPKNAFTQLMSSDGTPIRMTRKMPLYLQHAGHSRTIVGFEVDSQGNSNLLIFDPAKDVPGHMKLASKQLVQSQTLAPHGSPTNAISSSSLTPSRDLPPPHSPDTSKSSSRHLLSLKRLKQTCNELPTTQATIDVRQHSKLLSPFRVSIKLLSRRDQYQILCIDDGPALISRERNARKVIQSTRVE